jgi:hypothetical protein
MRTGIEEVLFVSYLFLFFIFNIKFEKRLQKYINFVDYGRFYYLCIAKLINMDTSQFLPHFLQEVRRHPNVTALKHGETLTTNARLVQYIAPIMNELDTSQDDCFALLAEQSVYTAAALFAAVFTGKQVVPVAESWPGEQRARVLADAGLTDCLTAQRMGYYYWMTVEDALDRLDNGLIQLRDDQVVARCYAFPADGNLHPTRVTLHDLMAGTSGLETFFGTEVMRLFSYFCGAKF